MNKIESAANKILRKYEIASDEAWENYRYATKYGKKAEKLETRKVWQEATAVLVAVDTALYDLRWEMERDSA
jgi:hypothetical protein